MTLWATNRDLYFNKHILLMEILRYIYYTFMHQ